MNWLFYAKKTFLFYSNYTKTWYIIIFLWKRKKAKQNKKQKKHKFSNLKTIHYSDSRNIQFFKKVASVRITRNFWNNSDYFFLCNDNTI